MKGGKFYGKKVIGFSVDDSIGYIEATCVLEHNGTNIVTDEFHTLYNYQVLVDIDENTEIVQSVGVDGADRLLDVIDKEDCLPDIGLLDYENKDLGLNLKDITLRELYKEVLKKVL